MTHPSQGPTDNCKEALLAGMRALHNKGRQRCVVVPSPHACHESGQWPYHVDPCEGSMVGAVNVESAKTSPEQDRDMLMWRHAVFESKEIYRLGWHVVASTPATDLTSASGEIHILSPTAPERRMACLCHFSDARWLLYAWMPCRMVLLQCLPKGHELWTICSLGARWRATIFAGSVHGVGRPSAACVCVCV